MAHSTNPGARVITEGDLRIAHKCPRAHNSTGCTMHSKNKMYKFGNTAYCIFNYFSFTPQNEPQFSIVNPRPHHHQLYKAVCLLRICNFVPVIAVTYVRTSLPKWLFWVVTLHQLNYTTPLAFYHLSSHFMEPWPGCEPGLSKTTRSTN